jgi:pimeloyl-ACP methyl ester carboxylesterase
MSEQSDFGTLGRYQEIRADQMPPEQMTPSPSKQMTRRGALASLSATLVFAAVPGAAKDPMAGATPAATSPMGQGRFFINQTFNFQTLRVLGYSVTGGADTGEILESVRHIPEGDVQAWYASWIETGQRVLALADKTRDPLGRGGAYMRAHNYFQTGEFLLPPDDPKRSDSWKRNLDSFAKGLEALGVPHERFRAPYPGGGLRAIYYLGPAGAEKKPLVMIVGGYDSTMEELYFMLGKPALDRGYSVLTYEGPGQGDALRSQGLHFLPEWERPNGAVLEEFLRRHKRPEKIVLVGVSMGGYFAPRAAAFDDRIDGVVAYDCCYDFGSVFGRILNLASDPILSKSPDFVWAINNFRWTMGVSDIASMGAVAQRYTLAPVASRIKQPVLILAGAEDHFIPLDQTAEFAKALVNAKSVTTQVFDRASGGAEHCQNGNMTLVHAAVFSWIEDTFE